MRFHEIRRELHTQYFCINVEYGIYIYIFYKNMKNLIEYIIRPDNK